MRGGPFIAALAAGVLQAISIAAPWNGQPLGWLQVASLAVLAYAVQRAHSWKAAAVLGWSFATAWLACTFWWLYISMHVYGGLAAPLAAAAVLLLALFLGLDYALATALGWFAREKHPLLQAVAFAGAWLLAELMRGNFYTGLPWGASGYAHVDSVLGSAAPAVGVYGISFIAAFLSACCAGIASRRGRSPALWAGAIVVVVAAWFAAADRETAAAINDKAAHRKLPIALLQGNIPQDEKFQPGSGIPVALNWYAQQLRASTASLTVTPETAIPLLPSQLPPGYEQLIEEPFISGDRAALVGIPLGSFEDGYSNSVVGFAPGARVYRYDKHHLVPFGEFIPPMFKWFVRLMNIPLGDFNRGSLTQPPFAWKGERLAPNICYEDLFGEELAAHFADAAKAPTILVNMSNIGWFGDSIAIDQHLAISRMRAIEFDRPVIRATNTGATAIVDHRGRVVKELPRLTRGVLTGDVEGRDDITPYAAWVSRFGLWPLWVIGAVCLALGLARRRRRAAQ